MARVIVLLLALGSLLPATTVDAQLAFQERGESDFHLGPVVLDRVGSDDDSEARFVGGAARSGVTQLQGRLLTRTIDGETTVGMELEGMLAPARPFTERRIQPFLLLGYARDKRTVPLPPEFNPAVADDEIDVDVAHFGGGLFARIPLGREWILAPALWIRHSLLRGDDYSESETVGRLEAAVSARVHTEISVTGSVGAETGTGAAQLWLGLGVRFDAF